MALPEGFSELYAALNAPEPKAFNLIGVVTDFLPPTPTRGTDWTCTFHLKDKSIVNSYDGNGLRVRFFRKELSDLPKIEKIGDVIVLRGIKAGLYKGSPVAVSAVGTQCVVLPYATIPTVFSGGMHYLCVPGSPPLVRAEQQYVVTVKNDLAATLPAAGSRPASLASPTHLGERRASPNRLGLQSSLGPKFSVIRDIEAAKFYTLVAEVVKVFPTPMGSVDLYITDYTINGLLYEYRKPDQNRDQSRDGDTFGYTGASQLHEWSGPYGRQALHVELMPPHASYAQLHVKPGSLVLLTNVRAKMSRANVLEANLWPEDREPNRIRVEVLKGTEHAEVKQVLNRRDHYWQFQPDREKPALVQPGGASVGTRKKGRAEKKAKQKANKKAKAAAAKQSDVVVDDVLAAQKSNRGKPDLSAPSKHIRCENPDHPVTLVKYILNDPRRKDLPFMNAKWRARLRIIDFYPKDLADFSRPIPDEPDAWQWAFHLYVEDSSVSRGEPSNMVLDVVGQDAVYLLKLDACDLKKGDPPAKLTLAKLREKLFVLWGDLEERRRTKAAGTAPAFDCCLFECGVPRTEENGGGWCRLHRMFGTTIM
ncbi:hypothetical protein LTR66_008448 [Elasticomyces elasticus]|nr:hypothetical protein LTR66_008448 [Elasticomyces elasticus]